MYSTHVRLMEHCLCLNMNIHLHTTLALSHRGRKCSSSLWVGQLCNSSAELSISIETIQKVLSTCQRIRHAHFYPSKRLETELNAFFFFKAWHHIQMVSSLCPFRSLWPGSITVSGQKCHGGAWLSGGELRWAHPTQEADQPSEGLPEPPGPAPRAAHESEEVRGTDWAQIFFLSFVVFLFCRYTHS